DTVPEGRYKIRAYTNWMRNTGEDFFFAKDVYISNPYFKVYATKDEIRRIKKSTREVSRKEEKYDISFHPEGGALLEGVENRVAFKAINDLGLGADFDGRLSDKKGILLTTFESEHLGMGTFTFTPEAGNNYFVNARFPDGKERKFSLPKPIEMGVNLKINHLEHDSIQVRLLTNITPDIYPPNTNYHLLAHTRGNVRYTGELDLTGTRMISIAKDIFPNGVTHFTLFNSAGKPVSERLVFIYNDPVLQVDIQKNKSLAGKREKLNSTILVHDHEGNPVKGNFSLAVVKNSRLKQEKSILSELLLSSDLKGFIENPDYYFTNSDEVKSSLLENLLLTQGWKRFNWGTVIVNKKLPVEYPVEQGIEINGRITREFFSLPLHDIRVTLTILNQFNDVYTTRSGPRGYFSFKDLNYADTVEVKVEAVRHNGKKNLVIVLEQQDPMHMEDMQYRTSQYLQKPGEKGRWVSEKTPEEIEKENDPFYEENNTYHRIHQEPKDVIKVDETMQNYNNVAQMIQGRVPGVIVSGNNITIRGVNSFYGGTDPLFIIDGIPSDKNFAMSMNPNDIDRIEILKGPDAAIYGSRGANGVIAIYTKRGKFMLKGVIDFRMLGYHTPHEFYSPKYEVKGRDEKFDDDRTTLFWEPDIITGEDGKATVEFYTSDLEGDYSILVEGMDKNGRPGTGEVQFSVK
ncbi:MAG: TonB-dependent receptor plug domain-containing protein, partial [Bacteroidota bacterium]